MSTRVAAKLKHARTGRELLFVGVHQGKRADNQTNANRAFTTLKSGKPPYFKEVKGPWTRMNFGVSEVEVADVNGDSHDGKCLPFCKDLTADNSQVGKKPDPIDRVTLNKFLRFSN